MNESVPIVHDVSGPRRRIVVVGHRAMASANFSIENLPSSSGRLDVLIRCVRAAFLVSDGIRRDVVLYLVLLGGPEAPRTLRFDGTEVRFLRPDERHTAITVKKVLERASDGSSFELVAPGIAAARVGLDGLREELTTDSQVLVLDERARTQLLGANLDHSRNMTLLLGDHTGFTAGETAMLAQWGATMVSVSPRSLHAEDAIAVAHCLLDTAQVRAS